MTTSTFPMFNTDMFANFFPMPDQMNGFAKTAMEASTESTRASVKGMQEVGSTMMSHMKQQMNLSVEAQKKLAEVSSLEDAMGIQANYMKAAVEANIKGYSEISELYADTMRDFFAPIVKSAKKASKAV